MCDLFFEFDFIRIDTERNIVLSEQTSLFRINCVDCLDRTNVVQAAIAKNCLEIMVGERVEVFFLLPNCFWRKIFEFNFS